VRGNTEKQYPRTHVGILERVVASINSGVGEGGGSSDRGEERREREVREQWQRWRRRERKVRE
jgi:hypothetical protein